METNKRPDNGNTVIVIAGAILLAWMAFNFFSDKKESNIIATDYTTFYQQVENKSIESVNIDESQKLIIYTLKDSKDIAYSVVFPGTADDISKMIASNSIPLVAEPPVAPSFFKTMILYLIPTVLFIAFLMWHARKNEGMLNSITDRTKTRARIYDPASNKVRLSDVAGNSAELTEVKEIIHFIKNPKAYADARAKFPKGILLSGPPGNGKTLLCKAIAGEAGVPFFYMSGSDFVEMFVGVGAGRIRDTFKMAKEHAPCIVFIDEIDTIGNARGNFNAKEHDQTLNQLLVEMDGFEEQSGVLLLAATNRVDMLDPALIRPGRFDRTIFIGLPDLSSREEILKIHLKDKNYDANVDITQIAKGTPGFSGAELASVVNEAAIFAARESRTVITHTDLDKAKDKVMMGPESTSKKMSEKELKITAYHEAGHAIVGLTMPEHDPIYKVSITPRGSALGVTMFLPDSDQYSQNKTKLHSYLCSLMAGRAAEELIFGKDYVTTGASSDIEKATGIAKNMVTRWGLSSLGMVKYSHPSEWTSGSEVRTSNETSRLIDLEIQKIITDSYNQAIDVLTSNSDKLHAMATLLLEKETINKDEIEQIMKETNG